MLLQVVFGAATFLLGGASVIFLECWHNNTYESYSDIEAVFWLGNCVFLPLYNALTVTAVLARPPSSTTLLAAGTVSLAAMLAYQFAEQRFRAHKRVTPTELYHVFFICL